MKAAASRTVLACVALVLLAGCQRREDGPVGSTSPPTMTAHDHGKGPASRTVSRSPGKPKAPVSISIARGTASVPVGAPTGLVLILRTDAGADGVEVTLEGEPGVDLLAPSGPVVLGPVPAGGQAELPVQLVVTGQGAPRLSGLIVLESAGQRQARAVSVNVPVEASGSRNMSAGAAAASKAVPVRDSTGELIHSMRVEAVVE